jgi:hypothetical protein
VALGDLSDDRQAEPGSRLAARGLGAVEAVEDERAVGFGDAGAVVTNDYLALEDRQVDAAAAVAPFGGVLDEVPERPFEFFRVAPRQSGVIAVSLLLAYSARRERSRNASRQAARPRPAAGDGRLG